MSSMQPACTLIRSAQCILLGLCCFPGAAVALAVDVLEIGSTATAELPRGKEADGIIGDFVIRNAHLEALVAGNLPERRANMSTNYSAPTPGCLYDLCVRSAQNDQLTYLGPGGLEGPVSYVRAIGPADNPLGASGVRVERTAARGEGRAQRHDYVLNDDWRFLAILSTYRNEADKDWEVTPDPTWKEFTSRATIHGIFTGDATNPTDRQGYAAAVCEWQGAVALGAPAVRVALKPGEEKSFLTVVAPGTSPAAAFGILARLKGPTGTLRGRVAEAGQPITSGSIEISFVEPAAAPDKPPVRKILLAYADPEGRFETALPPGEYRVEHRDLGRPPVVRDMELRAETVTELEIAVAAASRVAFRATVEGKPVPCRVQFVGLGETKSPHFGVDIQARGCRNWHMTETGSFTRQVDPGKYRLIATRGIEYDHAERDIEVKPGETASVAVELRRVVDSRGWVSTDFHNHSTPSGDNYCGTDDRLINLAAEQVEFAPTTEHNRLYDWTPHIERLGLKEELRTVPGIELTGSNAHFNAFPFKVVPFAQDGGAPRWQFDPRLNAIVLRDYQEGGPYRWVHLNHPQVGKFFRDRNEDGVADGGYAGLEFLIDAAEVWSEDILNPTPRLRRVFDGKEYVYENRTLAWLQLLNQGVRMNCIAVSDAHAVFGNSVGGWRTYVRSSEDRPAQLNVDEVIRSSKAGRLFVTTGPFLEVKLDDGTEPGGSTIARGTFHVHARVQCTDWIDIDRVQVLVNGRPDPDLNFTRRSHADLFRDGVVRFEHRIPATLREDAHLIVVAIGERSNLRVGYGRSTQAWWSPVAFTNPMYIDIDGHGWRPNGDTLGHPLPLGK